MRDLEVPGWCEARAAVKALAVEEFPLTGGSLLLEDLVPPSRQLRTWNPSHFSKNEWRFPPENRSFLDRLGRLPPHLKAWECRTQGARLKTAPDSKGDRGRLPSLAVPSRIPRGRGASALDIGEEDVCANPLLRSRLL